MALREIHSTFVKEVLSRSWVPDSHSLLPPLLKDIVQRKEKHHLTSKLSSCLLHNAPTVSEKLAKFCAECSMDTSPDTSPSSTEDVHGTYHYYHLAISPSINYTDKMRTQVFINGKMYTFDGFTLMSQQQLQQVPPLCFQQNGYNYCVKLKPIEDEVTAIDALLFEEYLFNDILQLYDFTHVLKCLNARILFIPRFVDPDMTVLSMSDLLPCMIETRKPLLVHLKTMLKTKTIHDLNQLSDGWIITNPNRSPSSIRIDRLEWSSGNDKGLPWVVHFSSVFGDSTGESHGRPGQEVFRSSSKEMMLRISSDKFLMTGICTDIIQHALLLPLLVNHILSHNSLSKLEEKLNYHFIDRQLLERALTNRSYSPFGTVLGTQVKLTASNCGLRRPKIREDWTTASRDLKAEVCRAETHSEEQRLRHNEQLEFLGDAILEYLCSLHLYHMLPNAKLGQLASYRTLLIKNKHLAILAQRLELQKYVLTCSPEHPATVKHGPLSSHPASHSTSKSPTPIDSAAHAVANTLEAVIGAVYLDTGLSSAQRLIAQLFFPEEDLHTVWMNYPLDPLQVEHPEGDRHLIAHSSLLQRLVKLEEITGVQFTHIRLLAKVFTHSSMQHSSLVGGSYEKLEHLGDAILQFLTSDYLYRKFPTLHEGHLSLLRTTLVQNKQLSELCKQLGFDQYIRSETAEVGIKILADVVESYLAALLLDKGLDYCQSFLEVCLFPKLSDIVGKSTLEDANSQLQKAIARLSRQLHLEHENLYYRQLGTSQDPPFTVGVYFRGQRLETGIGDSLRDARRKAAERALESDALKQMWRNSRQKR